MEFKRHRHWYIDDCIESDDDSENGDNDFDANFIKILPLYIYIKAIAFKSNNMMY